MSKDWGAKIISSDIDDATGLGKVAYVIVNQSTGQTIPTTGTGEVSGINSVVNLQNYFRDQIATITKAAQVKSDLTGLAGTFLDIPDEVPDVPPVKEPPVIVPPTPRELFLAQVGLYFSVKRLMAEGAKLPGGVGDVAAQLSVIDDMLAANPELTSAF